MISVMDTNFVILADGLQSPSLGWIAWIIIGGLAGWIGSKIMKTDQQMGIIANVVVGIIGGFLGGWILSGLLNLDVEGGGWIFSFITCLIGACLLLFILKLIFGRNKTK